MFGSVLDAEHLFDRMDPVTRTRVRRRRLTLTISLVLVAAAWAGPAVRALGFPETPERVSRASSVVREGDTPLTIARERPPAGRRPDLGDERRGRGPARAWPDARRLDSLRPELAREASLPPSSLTHPTSRG
jgi:hypothetical protein